MAEVIELEEIHRIYRAGAVEVAAVQGVCLRIEAGEFVAIMGASGSGKSTLMNIIGCLDRPTKGRYRLAGQEVSELDRNALAGIRNRQIGFVFQNFNLLPRTTALENVELPLLYSADHLPATTTRDRALEALRSVGIAERAGHAPSQLSGGQQQRVAIARALVTRPAILLADEPTGNLDSHASIELMGLLQRLNDEGLTVVMVTHEHDIAAYARRNVVMCDGRIQRDAPVTARLAASAAPGESPPSLESAP